MLAVTPMRAGDTMWHIAFLNWPGKVRAPAPECWPRWGDGRVNNQVSRLLESHPTPASCPHHPLMSHVSYLCPSHNPHCLSWTRDSIVNQYLLFIIPDQTVLNIGRLLNFNIINTAWRDFEIKFMIFNLNSFKVLGPLAIMAHTWTLGGDLSTVSTGNWNENLNCKLWFWIWNFHGTQRIFFISLYVDELLKELGLQSFQHWGDGHMVA